MPQSRKWQLTINNPVEKGYNHEKVAVELQRFSGLLYYCLCDEIGSGGTYHTHVYFVLRTPTVHTVVNNRFPSEVAHRETAHGTSQENRDYIRKDGVKYNKSETGQYKYTDSGGTLHEGINLTDTFEEWGEMPQERQGKSKDVERIYCMIKDGASNQEIVEAVPSGMMNIEKIDRTRSMLRDAEYANTWRELEVTYIYGATGTGKTRGVLETYGYGNCYRVTDYKHPFDAYDGQDVILFEEYRGQFKISDILNYLDGYPLQLPCRYFNRQACYTKVFIISNVPPENQYCGVFIESLKAFYRRINRVLRYDSANMVTEYEYHPGASSFVPFR